MDGNNWRPAAPGEDDHVDWRTQLQTDSRQRIVNKIMETLKRHLPFSGPEGLQEIKTIAVRFEENIYTAASSQPDYLRKISLKMLTMENRSQNIIQNTWPVNPASNSNSLPDTGVSHSLPSPVQNPSQAHQQLVSQNVQNNTSPGGVQISAGLNTSLPSVSGISHSPMTNVVGLDGNMSSISQASCLTHGFKDPAGRSGQVNGGDWQEEANQKVRQMTEKYMPELTDVLSRVAAKLREVASQQPKSDQHVKLESDMQAAQRFLNVLQIPKTQLTPDFKERSVIFEKQIESFLGTFGPRKAIQLGSAQPKEPLPSSSDPTLSCPICLSPLEKETTTRCGHMFCEKCIKAALAKKKRCPTCRRKVVARNLIRVYLGINTSIP